MTENHTKLQHTTYISGGVKINRSRDRRVQLNYNAFIHFKKWTQIRQKFRLSNLDGQHKVVHFLIPYTSLHI